MPTVESTATRAAAQRATSAPAKTAGTTTATDTTGTGLDAAFAQMIAAVEAATAQAFGKTDKVAATTDTTSTDKTSTDKTVADDKAASDLAGALAVLVQGSNLDLATTGGLASPASLGAQSSAVSATSSAKAGVDASPSTAAPDAAPTTAATSAATATTTATTASTTTPQPDTAATATAAAAASDATKTDAAARDAATAAGKAEQQATDNQLALQSLVARRSAPEKSTGAGTPQVYGRPTPRGADANSTTSTAADRAAAVAQTLKSDMPSRSLHTLEDPMATDGTADQGKTPMVADRAAGAATIGDAPIRDGSQQQLDTTATTTDANTQVGAVAAAPHHATTADTTPDRADTTTTNIVHTATMATVADTIATHAKTGSSHFAIKLDPAELGSVDIRVEVKSSGEVRAHLIVERADTLDMMMRDQKTLERSLGNAGLDVGSSGLQFSLKDQGGGNSRPDRNQTASIAAPAVADTGTVTPDLAVVAYRARRAGGLDLRI